MLPSSLHTSTFPDLAPVKLNGLSTLPASTQTTQMQGAGNAHQRTPRQMARGQQATNTDTNKHAAPTCSHQHERPSYTCLTPSFLTEAQQRTRPLDYPNPRTPAPHHTAQASSGAGMPCRRTTAWLWRCSTHSCVPSSWCGSSGQQCMLHAGGTQQQQACRSHLPQQVRQTQDGLLLHLRLLTDWQDSRVCCG